MKWYITLIAAVILAVCARGYTLEIGLNAENLPEIASALPQFGIRTVRIMTRWQAIEPYEHPTEPYRTEFIKENQQAINRLKQRGIEITPPLSELDEQGFYWKKYDERFAAARKAGLDVLFTLRATSLWGTEQKARLGNNGGYVVASAPKDMARWRTFVKAFVSRYSGKGMRVFYEVENEVNAKAFWTGGPDKYAELLRETYKTIKSAAPDAQVLHAPMACGMTADVSGNARALGIKNHDAFLKKIFADGAFDIISTHDYYFPDNAVNGFTFDSYLRHIKELAAKYGQNKKPIWITETGYVTVPTSAGRRTDPGSRENQAKWFTGAAAQAESAGADRMLWMLIADRQEPYFGSMGLLEPDGTPRPVCAKITQINKSAAKIRN